MNNKHSKIAIVIGTKAELIKCVPIMLELKNRGFDYWFIHTGQHPLGEACESFEVKRPDFILSEEPDLRRGSKFWAKMSFKTFFWCFDTMFQIRKLLIELKPKYVIYHGDTMNTAMAVGASSRLLNPRKKWKSVHLEAGLKSGSLLEPIPEEFTRQVVDMFTDIFLAPSELATENLKKKFKFVNGKILNVGNTGVDSSLLAWERAKGFSKKPPNGYALINLHRYENLRSRRRMEKIVEILSSIKIDALWPIHNTTKDCLERYGLISKLQKMKNIKLTPLVDYFQFISLLSNCTYLITDGGSIQEESLVFKKPCVILRKRTERQEGLKTGINFLTKLDVNYSKKIIGDIEKGKIKIENFQNPYGKKGLTKRIVDILLK